MLMLQLLNPMYHASISVQTLPIPILITAQTGTATICGSQL